MQILEIFADYRRRAVEGFYQCRATLYFVFDNISINGKRIGNTRVKVEIRLYQDKSKLYLPNSAYDHYSINWWEDYSLELQYTKNNANLRNELEWGNTIVIVGTESDSKSWCSRFVLE